MSDCGVVDTRLIAQSMKGQAPPYQCPRCLKSYKSITGILYHLGQVGPLTYVPRCMLGEETPQGSPRPSPGSPGGLKRKVTRRDLTWAEAQRLVEVDFDNSFRRIEIDNDLEVDITSDDEAPDGAGSGGKRGKTPKRSGVPRTPQRAGKGYTPKGKSTQNKGKRKSKLKTPSKDGQSEAAVALPQADSSVLEGVDFPDAPKRGTSYYRFVEQSVEDLDEMVEYDMDEEDYQWLTLVNEDRKTQGLTSVPQDVFEILMDRLEKECFFESHMPGEVTGEASNMYNIDENAVCCICNDGECHNTNAILFCDMCNLAVHQECYGVPYIPEGQWLCRRCLQSPSRGVDCVLCPNKGGAFKQTVDSRWSHVICALWIPEVQFANTVFLEPIDGIKEIPPARWKLTCYICRRRMGACIQCAKANCYVAFHVTCAQQAGLHMKIEIIKGGEIRKSAFCKSHTPASIKKKRKLEEMEREKEEEEAGGGGEAEVAEGKGKEAEDEEKEKAEGSVAAESEGENRDENVEDGELEGLGKHSAKRKGKGKSEGAKNVKKQLEDRKTSMQPVVNIPYVPQHRLDRIISRVSLHKKSQFIPKLVSYWKLKRQSRNGVPLLRRMQASNQGQRTSTANLTEEEREVLAEQLSLWKKLRHDLERARLLAELVRKRERLKREQLQLLKHRNELQLCPLTVVIKRALDRLARKDPANIFADPVSVEEVPDYLDIIRHPMDFATMRKKAESHQYTSLSELEKDFYHVWHNATIYNQKDTIYYRAAARIREAGTKILEEASRQVESAGMNAATGLHSPEVPEPPPLVPRVIPSDVQNPLDLLEIEDVEEGGETRGRDRLDSMASVSLDEQVEFLEEKLGVLHSLNKGARKGREKALRKELNALRRQMRAERKALRTGSESDEQTNSPRRRAPSIPRNAEELASHVLHGSLRLTPSRKQILSYSGISLEERASMLQEQINQAEAAAAAAAALSDEEQPPKRRKRSVSPSSQPRRDKVGKAIPSSKSDSCVAKIKKKAQRIRKRKYQKERERSRSENANPEARDSARERMASGGTSVSENEHPLNGRTRLESSSSVYETPAEDFSNDDEKPLRSPLSDSGPCHHRRLTSSASENAVPSASSVEDLTVRGAPAVSRGRNRGNMRRRSSSSNYAAGGGEEEDGGEETRSRGTAQKRKHGASVSAPEPESDGGSVKRTKTINGLVNGAGAEQFEIKPLLLVWAKCRGYPPYPALVIDPDMPSRGLRINGEKIPAPSDEVLDLRDKNPTSSYLVRFFDGRRTWQWLPSDKIEPLGVSAEYDSAKVAASGASKRSVQQAFQRAKQYQRKVAQSVPVEISSSSSSDSDDDDDDDDDVDSS